MKTSPEALIALELLSCRWCWPTRQRCRGRQRRQGLQRRRGRRRLPGRTARRRAWGGARPASSSWRPRPCTCCSELPLYLRRTRSKHVFEMTQFNNFCCKYRQKTPGIDSRRPSRRPFKVALNLEMWSPDSWESRENSRAAPCPFLQLFLSKNPRVKEPADYNCTAP